MRDLHGFSLSHPRLHGWPSVPQSRHPRPRHWAPGASAEELLCHQKKPRQTPQPAEAKAQPRPPRLQQSFRAANSLPQAVLGGLGLFFLLWGGGWGAGSIANSKISDILKCDLMRLPEEAGQVVKTLEPQSPTPCSLSCSTSPLSAIRRSCSAPVWTSTQEGLLDCTPCRIPRGSTTTGSPMSPHNSRSMVLA